MTVDRARLTALRRSLLETHTALSPAGFARALDELIELGRVIGVRGERERIVSGVLNVVRDGEQAKEKAA